MYRQFKKQKKPTLILVIGMMGDQSEPQCPWISVLTLQSGSSSSHIQQTFSRGCRAQQGCRNTDMAWPLCYQARSGPARLTSCPGTLLFVHGHLQPADPSELQQLPSVLLLLLFSFCTVLPSGEVVVVAANTGSNDVGEANLQPLYAELWCGEKVPCC